MGIFDKEEMLNVFIMFLGFAIICLIGGWIINHYYVSQINCCCAGAVSKPCICWGFVDCMKEACGDNNEYDYAAMCCDRWVNCSALREGIRETWYGHPLEDDNAELEYRS